MSSSDTDTDTGGRARARAIGSDTDTDSSIAPSTSSSSGSSSSASRSSPSLSSSSSDSGAEGARRYFLVDNGGRSVGSFVPHRIGPWPYWPPNRQQLARCSGRGRVRGGGGAAARSYAYGRRGRDQQQGQAVLDRQFAICSGRGRGSGRPGSLGRTPTRQLPVRSGSASTSGRSQPELVRVRVNMSSQNPGNVVAPARRSARTGSQENIINNQVQVDPSVAGGSGAGAPAAAATTGGSQNQANGNAANLNMTLGLGGAPFECIVCLENLDSPATVSEVVPDPNGNPNPHYPNSRKNLALNKLRNLDVREIVTTVCGHMYHSYCVQKWFAEQGKKTCPSCRKNVGKLTKLFPNLGPIPQPQVHVQNVQAPAAAPEPLPSQPGPASGQQRRRGASGTTPGGNCPQQGCKDLRDIHVMLMSDFDELDRRYRTEKVDFDSAREDLELRAAEIASLQDRVNTLEAENEDLKAGGKRRRRCNDV